MTSQTGRWTGEQANYRDPWHHLIASGGPHGMVFSSISSLEIPKKLMDAWLDY